MKTIEEFYTELISNDDMKKEFLSLKPEEAESFAEKYGCRATIEEIGAYIAEKNTVSGELSDDDLENVSGGQSVDIGKVLAFVVKSIAKTL
ncbi:MAG: hypothetical protein ACI4KB_03870 [Oscillospiraceae bacterium]|nr:hypothetical protein [Oscillospiraceae bacterium]